MIIKNTEVEAQYPWPEDCVVQGGTSGLVIVRDGDNYTTAFVEAFPGTFIRGEGATIQEAEDSCWKQYQHRQACPGHEWEARNYKNGAGFCKHCNTFQSKVFTPEQLGLRCAVCDVPTFWSRRNDEFFCPEHATDRDTEWWRKEIAKGNQPTTGSLVGDILAALAAQEAEAER